MYNFFKYLLVRPIVRLLFRATLVGAENVPAAGGALLASNHLAAGDTYITPAMLKRQVTFPAKAELFRGDRGLRSVILAWFMRAIKQVPLDRSGGRVSLAGLEPVLDALHDGRLVGIYPEGTRSPDGRLYKGHTGVARMALASGVPVIPVAVADTARVKGLFGIGWVWKPKVIIGKPIDFSRYAGMHDDRAVLRWVTDEVMAAIQELSGQTYIDAYASSVKRGALSQAESDARILARPGLGATPPPLPGA
ncbi:1-acyl-sn-glycerol-3-phosphate acyltransferase [Propionicimonas sp.]|uniref:lysophospholipid acyltransferase family protein n=1 Tax=Propionicimonas sp. TaxID=1955623 RepID=UPI0017CD0BB3|nr:lysophospholipid acyltransferase family protein [Propionicimonas sp.]MBU3976512.1 1-acyl-sn-glycerol-3-phosphate acyltransferase [Actinomycetota bacterium]MBA3020488.1 1-acyl-sn-glycerol-3-phosphate acyltransferase [Propionicimonas sp.]MBU3986661.1 1-acyl-sn-glycerol-3-phosphate acyltransferase [Actinomycetota bacterium]MBU4007187.1 1-acyl-sn-glycerol-3-phosphate acyltransferase [Actinomycetota bacterium]MBU4064940.1 1-acyl-sn-glycerol-3-phosphate acyltransferase [Actinomycetota bacterium]